MTNLSQCIYTDYREVTISFCFKGESIGTGGAIYSSGAGKLAEQVVKEAGKRWGESPDGYRDRRC